MTDQPASLTPPSQGYASLLADIKQRVRQAQVRAMLSVNAELIRLYWGIGQMIHERQRQEGLEHYGRSDSPGRSGPRGDR